jgi:hypothetical protein
MKTRIQKEFTDTITRTPSCGVTVIYSSVSSTAIKGKDVKKELQDSSASFLQTAMSVIVNADTISSPKVGDPITIGEYGRVVTSASVDPIGALRKIGVSEAFDTRIFLTGRRNELSIERGAKQSTYCIRMGVSDEPSYGDLPNEQRNRWNFVIRECDWLDHTRPQVGDLLTDEAGNDYSIMSAEYRPRYWILICKEVI